MTDASASTPDPFVTDSSSQQSNTYDATKFYTVARDKKGFTTTVRVSIPPSVMSQIASLIATQTIPEYRTSADVLRDALVHRLVWLGENTANVVLSDLANAMIAETRSEGFLRQRESVRKTLNNYEDALRMAGRTDQLKIIDSMKGDLGTKDNTFREGLTALITRYS